MDAVNREKYGLRDRPPSTEDSVRIQRKKELVELFTDIALKLQRGEITVTEFAEGQAEKHLQLEEDAERDPLTGLLNRRGFVESFDNKLLSFRRTLHKSNKETAQTLQKPECLGCVVIFDLDHFGLVNKEHGEHIGDATLQQVAAVLTESIRPDDLIARIGGEEFAGFFPGLSLEAAGIVIEKRFRNNLPNEVAKKLADLQFVPIRQSASFGLASLPLDLTEEELFDPAARSLIFKDAHQQAITAMRFAKANGRNQTAVWHADERIEVITPPVEQPIQNTN